MFKCKFYIIKDYIRTYVQRVIKLVFSAMSCAWINSTVKQRNVMKPVRQTTQNTLLHSKILFYIFRVGRVDMKGCGKYVGGG